jgi:GT2 family glycosyltransferase
MELSIITVVKNDFVGLLETRESVIRQTGINITHIIVDAASSDGSERIAAECSDVVLPSFEDGGIYQGMQRGSEVADNRYIMFLNSSDVLIGSHILAEVIGELESSGAQWGFGPIIEKTMRNTLVLTDTTGPTDLDHIAWRKTFVPFPTTILKKSFFENLGGFSFRYRIAGDFDLLVRASKQSTPFYWSVPLVIFSAGGASYTRAPLGWEEEHQIRRNVLNITRRLNLASQVYVNRRKIQWLLGKAIDFFQSTGIIGKKHWRDRRATNITKSELTRMSN